MFFLSLLYGIVQYPRDLIYRNIGEHCGSISLPSIKVSSSTNSIRYEKVDLFVKNTLKRINRDYTLSNEELEEVQKIANATVNSIKENPKITALIFQFYSKERKSVNFEGFILDGIAKQGIIRISTTSASQEMEIDSDSFIATTSYDIEAGAIKNVKSSFTNDKINHEQIVALCDSLYSILFGISQKTFPEIFTGNAARYILDNIEYEFELLKKLELLDDLEYSTGAVKNYIEKGKLNLSEVTKAIAIKCAPTPTPTPTPTPDIAKEFEKILEEILDDIE